MINWKGLSPRVRGNREGKGGKSWIPRSIPACAGEPAWTSASLTAWTVYPRVCGGTRGGLVRAVWTWGLSPRVRGNRLCELRSCICVRSIPACAGEPTTRIVSFRDKQVYPRVCGGTRLGPEYTDSITGLSPRVRGNRPRTNMTRIRPRSIPACAGEPLPEYDHHSNQPVYPRVCGGTETTCRTLPAAVGLSPRVRGNPEADDEYTVWGRSIPACAGEPLGSMPFDILHTVYPRVCGGTSHARYIQPESTGLSPRVRGNLGRGAL